jgi:prepilin-type N-terminal cleavage/methylation domain-containing protein
MRAKPYRKNEAGFSLVELMIAVGVFTVLAGAALALMRDSLKVGTTTYELTDAQQNLRNSQEYINRDLINAGDGLNSITKILVPRTFVTNYLAVSPFDNPGTPGYVNLALVNSDNNVAAATAVRGTSPAVTVRSSPAATDRISMLEIDPSFTPIALAATAIPSSGSYITVPAADMSKFSVGEVYFLTSSAGATFGAITTTTPASYRLNFANGDTLGLNVTGSTGMIGTVSGAGTLPTSLLRMQIVHYFINSNGLLVRRTFGVKGAGYRDSIIAEHGMNMQVRYFLNLRGADGNMVQPVTALTTSTQQLAVRQVEITVTCETPHAIATKQQQQLTMTTSTSVRNMQFRQTTLPTVNR